MTTRFGVFGEAPGIGLGDPYVDTVRPDPRDHGLVNLKVATCRSGKVRLNAGVRASAHVCTHAGACGRMLRRALMYDCVAVLQQQCAFAAPARMWPHAVPLRQQLAHHAHTMHDTQHARAACAFTNTLTQHMQNNDATFDKFKPLFEGEKHIDPLR